MALKNMLIRGEDLWNATNRGFYLKMTHPVHSTKPESEASRIKETIESDPKMLIEVFQKVFPNYDRSKGTLSMHKIQPYFESK